MLRGPRRNDKSMLMHAFSHRGYLNLLIFVTGFVLSLGLAVSRNMPKLIEIVTTSKRLIFFSSYGSGSQRIVLRALVSSFQHPLRTIFFEDMLSNTVHCGLLAIYGFQGCHRTFRGLLVYDRHRPNFNQHFLRPIGNP